MVSPAVLQAFAPLTGHASTLQAVLNTGANQHHSHSPKAGPNSESYADNRRDALGGTPASGAGTDAGAGAGESGGYKMSVYCRHLPTARKARRGKQSDSSSSRQRSRRGDGKGEEEPKTGDEFSVELFTYVPMSSPLSSSSSSYTGDDSACYTYVDCTERVAADVSSPEFHKVMQMAGSAVMLELRLYASSSKDDHPMNDGSDHVSDGGNEYKHFDDTDGNGARHSARKRLMGVARVPLLQALSESLLLGSRYLKYQLLQCPEGPHCPGMCMI